MSELSSRLALPFLQPGQAQKHVTHNEALARLDLLVQLVVQDFDATTPPVSPQAGQIWTQKLPQADRLSLRGTPLVAGIEEQNMKI